MTKKVRIGLDIGSSAVRAAEVVVDGDRKTLRRFAQVGLPAGAVVEGEVHDRGAVADAIKKLWQHGRFSGKKVVVGLGSQRAMVRQVEMPPMSDIELRSALRFKISEFLPIPIDQAVVDFAALPGSEGPETARRVLLLAAQRDVVVDEVAAVEAAGVRVEAVDSSSLALLRAAAAPSPPGGGDRGGGLEALVGIGQDLITVAVRDGGAPRFVRTVALAGSFGSQGLNEATLSLSAANERIRPGSARAATAAAANAPAARLDAIVSEVRSSLEYLLSQSGTGQFERVLVTGGGAMLAGVTAALSTAVGLPVGVAQTVVQVDSKELALEKSALDEASYRWLTCIGLALWGTDSYGRPSLLPQELVAKRQQRRLVASAAALVAVVAVGLGGTYLSRVHTAGDISSQIQASDQAASALQDRINALGYVLQVPEQVKSRRALAVSALNGDINWIGLLRRIDAALPPGVSPQSITMTKTGAIAPSAAGAPAGTAIGTLAMTAETTGGAATVAQFIDRVSHVKGLYALWVSSTTKSSGITEINASAELTTAALSDRAALLPGGTK